MAAGKKTNWSGTAALIAASSIIFFPLYLTVVIALKSRDQLGESILSWPNPIVWENFSKAIEITNYWGAFFNSFLITTGAVILTVFTNSFVAYAIARNMKKRSFQSLYYYFISAMFIPFPIIMLPIVKLTSQLGISNQVGLVILYTVYGLAFNVFLYVGYIASLPEELEEAARVDGCGPWQTFWKIIFPLLRPINATVAIFTVLWTWNDFMLPLVILAEPEMATLPLKQFALQGQFNTDYTLAFASYLLAMLPLLLVYIVAQRWIISGVTRGAVKG
ncbi:carbohydrate ABC transporter permease [Loktanella sp. IMCC34160]|uniref:carbohydrate ABC transporter permease n=1 Tax=Loktanella sp. IMCC34160 TaxID=2510646 RepID=UPI00101DAFB0|nr:carbohydrate ABC transporter permease [Loktanella sp. IMCC34160]RYG91768.1 carbohydrate ABC transporter permease [Loktanella sp. IMCC34160]